jgi:DMSO/TMAO reductase YedYZ molybdopterin-dependent catalytic subunit
MQERVSWFRRPFGVGFIAGGVAGIVASGVMLLLNATLNGLSLPQEFGSGLLALMPAAVFTFFHQAIGADAKYYFFGIVLVGQCLVFALSGALCNHYANRANTPLPWNYGLLLALSLWLFTGSILLPLTGSGAFGEDLSVGLVGGLFSLAAVGLIYGVLFVFTQRWMVAPREKKATGPVARYRQEISARRTLLKQAAVVAGLVVAGAGIWKFLAQGLGGGSKVPVTQLLKGYQPKIVVPTPNYGTIQPVQFLSPEITPDDQYYIVSKNFTDPTVTAQEWSLKVTGLVENPYTLSYAELLALPMQQQYESMECISNTVGGSYMSSALWQGVRLDTFLQKAGGVKTGATKVVLHAYDDYADSIHLSKALEPTTMVAVRMNSVTLPDSHGFPARVLVPGIFGMKHVKWLTEIEIVNYDFQGYWQQRGWDDAAPVLLTSRIDTPLDGTSVAVNQQTYIAGVAFSGNLGISEVEVSVDSGVTWQITTLKKPLSQLTWVLWELPWRPTTPGNYTVVVRAVDMQGNVQTPIEADPQPDGATGYDGISITVS